MERSRSEEKVQKTTFDPVSLLTLRLHAFLIFHLTFPVARNWSILTALDFPTPFSFMAILPLVIGWQWMEVRMRVR